MDFGSSPLVTSKMKSDYRFQVDLQLPPMPSCMFDQSPTTSILSPSAQNARAQLFNFHMSKENGSFSACRRRLDFSQGYQRADVFGIKPGQQITVARRNERERNRVKLINMTFATLRNHLPYEPETSKNKKLSKVDTLKSAISYIKFLQELVDNHDAVDAVFTEACALDSMQYDMRSCTSGTPEKSPMETEVESETSFDGLSAEEEELVDFTNWF